MMLYYCEPEYVVVEDAMQMQERTTHTININTKAIAKERYDLSYLAIIPGSRILT